MGHAMVNVEESLVVGKCDSDIWLVILEVTADCKDGVCTVRNFFFQKSKLKMAN